MKKIFVIICLIVSFIYLSGCTNNENTIVLNNMSDMRINFFEGQNSIFYATLCCGYREQNFAYNGISEPSTECGVVTLGYFEDCAYSFIEATLIVDGKETNIVLERSPYENVFMEDIGYVANSSGKVSIKLKNQQDIINLNCISKDWKINYKTAIQKASSHFKTQIKNLYFNNTFNAECYLKVVSKVESKNKYWYFSIIDKTGKNYSLLIDVNSGEIYAH